MKTIVPMHGRANVVLRPDIHNDLHGLLVKGGVIDSAVFGKVRVESPIRYKTPCPRDCFAFGEVMAMGHPSTEGSGSEPICASDGDIVGFDLHQCGHQIDASPYYERADAFVTLPWKEIACKFSAGSREPTPLGRWIMVEVDEVTTRRLVFGSSGSSVLLPGNLKKGVRTNSNSNTKVSLLAGKILSLGDTVQRIAPLGDVCPGNWALFSPHDAINIDLGKGKQRAFVRYDELEQIVHGEEKRERCEPLTTEERGALADAEQ